MSLTDSLTSSSSSSSSLTASASLSDYIPVPSSAAQVQPPPVPFSILPAPTTYVIVHRESEISRDVVQRLPENHQETINVVWVEETNEGIHSQLPHQVSRMVRERQQSQRIRMQERANASGALGAPAIPSPAQSHTAPVVMFYDKNIQSYMKHEGLRALMFLHTYKTDVHKHQLKAAQSESISHATNIQKTANSVQHALDKAEAHPATDREKKESIHAVIKSNAELQLQRIYQKMHMQHKPYVKDHGK